MRVGKMIVLLILDLVVSVLDECPICLENLDEEENLIECTGHKFHETCLYNWSKENQTCPNCRKEFPENIKKRLDELNGVIFEDKYMDSRKKIGEIKTLRTVCSRIKESVRKLARHRSYSSVFGESSEYHIPGEVIEYLEQTGVENHDPRSQEFRKNINIAVKSMMRYLGGDKTNEKEEILELVWRLLDVLWVGDCLIEYEHTGLSKIEGDMKELEIEENPEKYPALYYFMNLFSVKYGNQVVPEVGIDSVYKLLKSMISESSREYQIIAKESEIGRGRNPHDRWDEMQWRYLEKSTHCKGGDSFIEMVFGWLMGLIKWLAGLIRRLIGNAEEQETES